MQRLQRHPARLRGGGRAFHQRNGGSAGAAGHLTKCVSAGAGRIEAREANAALGRLTPQEACLLREIELINAARADPDIRVLRFSSTTLPCGGGGGGSAGGSRKCR